MCHLRYLSKFLEHFKNPTLVDSFVSYWLINIQIKFLIFCDASILKACFLFALVSFLGLHKIIFCYLHIDYVSVFSSQLTFLKANFLFIQLTTLSYILRLH